MAPASLIILSVLVVDIEAAVAVETKTEVMDSVKIETNLVGPAETYSLYKQMMEMKQHLLSNSSSADKPDPEPEILTRLKNALSLLYDAIVDGLLSGFLPIFEKQRREAREGEKNYLDILVLIIGALLGKQSCTNMMACRLLSCSPSQLLLNLSSFRTGKYVGYNLPNAGLIIVMLENIIPTYISNYFAIVKTAVFGSRKGIKIYNNLILQFSLQFLFTQYINLRFYPHLTSDTDFCDRQFICSLIE